MTGRDSVYRICMSQITCFVSGSHEGASQLVQGLDARKPSVLFQLGVQELQEGVRCTGARVAARSTASLQNAPEFLWPLCKKSVPSSSLA